MGSHVSSWQKVKRCIVVLVVTHLVKRNAKKKIKISDVTSITRPIRGNILSFVYCKSRKLVSFYETAYQIMFYSYISLISSGNCSLKNYTSDKSKLEVMGLVVLQKKHVLHLGDFKLSAQGHDSWLAYHSNT